MGNFWNLIAERHKTVSPMCTSEVICDSHSFPEPDTVGMHCRFSHKTTGCSDSQGARKNRARNEVLPACRPPYLAGMPCRIAADGRYLVVGHATSVLRDQSKVERRSKETWPVGKHYGVRRDLSRSLKT